MLGRRTGSKVFLGIESSDKHNAFINTPPSLWDTRHEAWKTHTRPQLLPLREKLLRQQCAAERQTGKGRSRLLSSTAKVKRRIKAPYAALCSQLEAVRA